MPDRYLLVHAGARPVGVLAGQVVEIVELDRIYPVPSTEPAIRGVITVRGRIVPVVHLGALLSGASCPGALGAFGVMLAGERWRLCLEVEAAEAVLEAPGLPLPPEAPLPWAVAMARSDDGAWVPLLDPGVMAAALAARIPEARFA